MLASVSAQSRMISRDWTIINLGDGHAEAQATFKYDDEPQWSMPVRAFNYALDLRDFPRDGTNIPEWLRRRLDEARKAAS